MKKSKNQKKMVSQELDNLTPDLQSLTPDLLKLNQELFEKTQEAVIELKQFKVKNNIK
jgi:hypothetical protein